MFPVCRVEELPLGEAVRVVVGGLAVAVFHAEEGFFALDDTCTHQDASLSEGWVQDCTVECPLHASAFDLRTGVPTAPPAKVPVRTHRVRVEDGTVVLDLDPAAAADPAGATHPAAGATNPAAARAPGPGRQDRR